MQKLTKAEEQIMQILWQLKNAFAKDIRAKMPSPQPPYNTVSSVIRVLVEKEFISYKAYGRTHEYYPVISKSAYRKAVFQNMLTNYFDGSYKQLASFFTQEENLSKETLEELLEELKKEE